MSLTRRSLLGAALVSPAVVLLSRPAVAAAPQTFQSGGIAINGTDPVAYFTMEKPVPGSADFTHEWNGATWQFSSADNRDAFAADPEKFAPKFGGYCAYAASLGYRANTVPEAWTIYEGALYLNASLRARELWLNDVPGNIAKGEANWPAILDA